MTPRPNLSKRAQQEANYLYLLTHVTASALNHIWGSDMTYIRLAQGWYPMTTMAAIDRVVHHSVILDLMAIESYRAQEAKEAHHHQEVAHDRRPRVAQATAADTSDRQLGGSEEGEQA